LPTSAASTTEPRLRLAFSGASTPSLGLFVIRFAVSVTLGLLPAAVAFAAAC